MKLLKKATNIFDGTINLLALSSAVILVLVMFAVLYEIFMRYFLNRPTLWVPEYTEVSLLFIVFLGTTWLLKKERHVSMDIVLTRLTPRTQTMVNIITSIIAAIVFLVVAVYGVEATWDAFIAGTRRSAMLRTPAYLIMFIIPVGSFMLFIQLLRRTYGYLREWRAAPDQEQGLSMNIQLKL